MTANNQYVKLEVKVDDLKRGMTIVAYTGFSLQYSSLKKEICDFIRFNFKGTKVIVGRGQRKLDIPVTDLKVGDMLIQIYNFSPELKKITQITPKFKEELIRRGMHRFKVQKKIDMGGIPNREQKEIIKLVKESTPEIPNKSKRGTSLRLEKKQKLIEQANKFVHDVKKGEEIRQMASQSIEETMDNFRLGKVDIREIKRYTNIIMSKDSADAMSAIISLKQSEQTYEHCIDVGVIFQSAYFKIIKNNGSQSVFKSKHHALLGSFLHDIGKSKIPKEILDNTASFEKDSRELQMLRSHTLYGAVMLSDMELPDTIVNMAHYHHIKQDTSMLSSYPEGVSWEEVSFETRLLSIVDIYQSLVGRRKYKKSWAAPAAMRYLDALSGTEYDQEIFEGFLHVIGIYPKGSLVELTDGSIGFVINVPQKNEDPERPTVVVVRNENGEDLEHHVLRNLQEERDISIVKDLDYIDVFGDQALEVFANINIS